jgi:alanyl-tRNA synthetase
MKKEVEKFQAQMVERTKNDLVSKAQEINGVKVVKAILPLEPNAAKDLVFKIREAIPENLVAVIGSTSNDKPMLSVMFSDDMVKNHDLNAGKMIREAAKLIKGGGGGQPHYAQAGGKDIEGINAAVDKIIELANL